MKYLSNYFNFKREHLSWLKRIGAVMPLLLCIGLALVLVMIWWLGPQWTWRTQQPLTSVAQRSIASLVLVMLPLVCWLIVLRSRFRRLQAERGQVDAIEADPSLAFVQEQQQALDQQLASYLKHAGGQRALYRLPCYLVLGAEGAGKSRLIERTQLNGCEINLTGPVRKRWDTPVHTGQYWDGKSNSVGHGAMGGIPGQS